MMFKIKAEIVEMLNNHEVMQYFNDYINNTTDISTTKIE